MDVNPFHSFYGVQKIFHHFFGQPETKMAYLFVGIYLYTQHCYFITSNYSLSITIYSARKDSPFCINSEYWRNFSTLIFRSTYHLVNLLKIHYYVSTRSDTNDLVHPRFPWKTESKDELPKSSEDINFSETTIKELNRKQFKPSEVASNLQKVRGYVNDGTRILNGITLDQLQWLGNRVEGYFFIYGFLQSATRPIFLFSEQLHNKQW